MAYPFILIMFWCSIVFALTKVVDEMRMRVYSGSEIKYRHETYTSYYLHFSPIVYSFYKIKTNYHILAWDYNFACEMSLQVQYIVPRFNCRYF
jgi:hypothetical protein